MAFFRRTQSQEKKNFVVKDGYNCPYYAPTGVGHSIFRILPAPYVAGGFQPQIVPVDGDALQGLSDSFCEIEIVDWFGNNQETFITTCSDMDDSIPSPTRIVASAVYDFVQSETEKIVTTGVASAALKDWSVLTKGKSSIVKFPQTRMLFQSALVEHRGKPCTDKHGAPTVRMPIIFCLNRSGTRVMEELLTTKIDHAADISGTNSAAGELTDPATGSLVKTEQYKNAEGQIRYKVYSLDQPYPIDPQQALSMFVPGQK